MMAVALLGAGFPVHAQTSAKDSLKVINLQEVQVDPHVLQQKLL